MKEQEPNKLTNQPNSSNLEAGGEIFMADGTNIGPEQSKNAEQEHSSTGNTLPEQRKKLNLLINNPETPIDVRRVVLTTLGGLEEKEKSKNPLTPEEAKIIETASDFYQAIAGLIEISDYDTTKRAIDEAGGDFIKFFTKDLPSESLEKYTDEFKKLKDLDVKEARERFSSIIINIGVERKKIGLEEPGVRALREEHEKNLPPELLEELNEPNSSEEDQAQGVGGSAGGNGNKPPITEADSSEDPDSQDPIPDDEFQAERQQILNDYRAEELSHRITSVQELAKWIIKNQDSELWGTEGIYPLLDKEENFNQANFMIWLREESVKHHKNNPNGEMTPLSSVGISTDYRDISVYAMSLLREQYMKDTNNHGKVLKELAGQLIYEGFMFGELRNMSLVYVQNMGDDKKIAEVLQQIHSKNTLTRPGNLEMLMTMSEEFDEDKNKRSGDTRVGDAFRIATDIYYNISDAEELKNILGSESITQEDFKNVFRILEGKMDWDEDLTDYGEFKYLKDDPRGFSYVDQNNNTEKFLFNKDGTINMDVFVRVMNFYDTPGEESTKMDFIREFVRLKAAQKAGLKKTGMSFSLEEKKKQREDFEKAVKSLIDLGRTKKEAEEKLTQRLMVERQAHRANMEYAEIMAFSMQRPYGSASKQDMERKGYDAMTKMNVQEYLHKQGDVNRGGAVGIPEQMGLFRDLSPDPLTGISTEGGKTIYEIMKDLRDIDNGKKVGVKKDLISKLRFKEYAEKYYASNQQARAVQIFHTLSDANELDLEKIVSWSYLEGVKYHVGEFQKQINEGVIKPFRYSFINSGLNFAEQVRIYDSKATADAIEKVKEENKSRKPEDYLPEPAPIYKPGNLAQKTLGKELYDKLYKDFYEQRDSKGRLLASKPENKNNNGEPDFNKFLESYDAKVRIAKNSSLGVFAAQLRSHRKLSSLGQSWGYHRTETFIDALKTIQAYEEDPVTGRYGPVYEKGKIKRYYSDKDIEWLRKNSGAEVWRMLLMDSVKEAGPAFAGGLLESFIKFFETLIKSEFKTAA